MDAGRAALAKNKAIVMQGATGIGKTAIGSTMVKNAVEKGRRTMFVVHRRELLEQTSKTLDRVGVKHGVIMAGRAYNPFEMCHIASIDTLQRRLDVVQRPDFMIVDECHRSGAKGWSKCIEWAKNGGAYVVGLTATPQRLDGKGLDAVFDDMVKGPSVEWLIENGFLSRFRVFGTSRVLDLSGVKTQMGDYAASQIDALMDNKVLFGEAVANYVKHASGKRAVAFCPSIHLSQTMAQAFNEAGIPAAHLDGGSDGEGRRRTIRDFADGKIMVLCNVNLFCEGFDLSAAAGKDVPIEAVILYRPTQSLALYLQQVGRALRPKAEPAIILDHAMNALRHGLPDAEHNWTLEGRKKGAAKAWVPPSKTCGECFAVVSAAYLECPECGEVFEVARRDIETTEETLVELTKEELQRQKKKQWSELSQARTQADLEKIARERGYKPGWVKYIMEARAAKGARGAIDRHGSIRQWKGEA